MQQGSLFLQIKPQKIQQRYRQYTEESMAKTYEDCQKGLSVYKAAVLYGILTKY